MPNQPPARNERVRFWILLSLILTLYTVYGRALYAKHQRTSPRRALQACVDRARQESIPFPSVPPHWSLERNHLGEESHRLRTWDSRRNLTCYLILPKDSSYRATRFETSVLPPSTHAPER